MPSFKDSTGREWLINLDGPKIREVRTTFQIDLAAYDGSAYAKFSEDYCLLVDVLWVLCRQQAVTVNITDADFGRAMVGNSLALATEALLDAITDFFPDAKKKLIRTLAEEAKTTTELGVEKAMATITDPEIRTRISTAMDLRIKEELDKLLIQYSSASVTPAPSASLPTVVPSAS